MKKEDIENKIAAIKANKAIPESAKATMLKVWEGKLQKAEKRENRPPAAKKKDAKRTEKKMVGDKKYNEVPCEDLKKEFAQRRQKAQSSEKKYRTKPVISKVASNVATAVHQVIENVPAADVNKKVTAQMIAFVRKGREFVAASKALMGSDYNQSKVNAEFDELHSFVQKLEKRLSKKK